MQVTFWGTRGSIAAPGCRTTRYGGNTSCVEIRSNSGTLIICDSGTGIRDLGLDLLSRGKEVHAHLLLSHTHWDHIQGWPFFAPAFAPGNEFTIHALAGVNQNLERVLASQMEYAYFPVTLDAMSAKIDFHEVREGEFAAEDVKITTHFLNHTTLCMGYRISADGRTVVYATDTEPHGLRLEPGLAKVGAGKGRRPHLIHEEDRRLAEFVAGADLLIMDGQYTDEEYPYKVGWGHATTGYATDVAVSGKAGRLALFHHDPTRADWSVDEIVSVARHRAAEYGCAMDIFGAREGLTIQL